MKTYRRNFILPVSADYLTTPVSPLPEVEVIYEQQFTGPQKNIRTVFPIEVQVLIKDWPGLTEEIKQAVESNARGELYMRRPRMRRSNEPRDEQERENQMVYKEQYNYEE